MESNQSVNECMKMVVCILVRILLNRDVQKLWFHGVLKYDYESYGHVNEQCSVSWHAERHACSVSWHASFVNIVLICVCTYCVCVCVCERERESVCVSAISSIQGRILELSISVDVCACSRCSGNDENTFVNQNPPDQLVTITTLHTVPFST